MNAEQEALKAHLDKQLVKTEKKGSHMRDRTMRCGVCAVDGEESTGVCYITANLDTGKIVKVILPPECKRPARCPEEMCIGVFARQFGSKILQAKDF